MAKYNRFRMKNGITFHSYPNNVSKFNSFEIYFLLKRTSKNIMLSNMVSTLFSYGPVVKDLPKYLKNMYGADMKFSCDTFDDKVYIRISMQVMADRYALTQGENLTKKAIRLLCNCVLNADINDRETFYRILHDASIETSDRDVIGDASSRAFSAMFPNTIAGTNRINSLVELDNISYNVFQSFYKELLATAEISIFASGDYDEDEMYNYLEKRFKKLIRSNESPLYTTVTNLVPSIHRDIIVPSKDALSNITLFYNFGGTNSAINAALIYVYSCILRDELYTVIRCENGLVYGIEVNEYVGFNLLTISANVSNANYAKVIKLIKECIEKLENKYSRDFLNIMLYSAKRRLKDVFRTGNKDLSFSYLTLNQHYNISEEEIESVTITAFKAFANSMSNNFVGSYFEKNEERS